MQKVPTVGLDAIIIGSGIGGLSTAAIMAKSGKKVSKLCFKTKMTKVGVGRFTSISGHFFANYINSFHKIEVLTVILKGLSCQNLKWIKSYDINHKFFC